MTLSGSRLPSPLRGIVPPLVTPLAGRDRLDVAGLERLIEHVMGGGVDALFVLGTTGEASGVSPRLRREVVERTCRQVKGRRPVLVGVTDTYVGESIELARYAAEVGAAAVVVAMPYYVPPAQDELFAYVRRVASEQALPVFLYNIPVLTKVGYEVETVRRLAEIEQVAGIKDSSGDIGYLRDVIAAAPRAGWSVLVGMEALLAEGIGAGAHGCVPAGGNVEPRLFVELYEAAMAKDRAAILRLTERMRLLHRIYALGPGLAWIVRGTKCALECMGICSGRMAEPFRSCVAEEKEMIGRYLVEMGLMT